MPKLDFKSSAKPSTFAYPPPLEDKKKETKEKVETAVLSTTVKQKKKEAGQYHLAIIQESENVDLCNYLIY